jgi:RNA polymerase sigma factor (sigma-70 family)
MTRASDNFYRAHYSRAYSWVLRKIRDKDDAHDLVAEIFTDILEGFETIENHEHYLNSAIYNAIKNYFGNKGKKQKHQPLEEIDPDMFTIESEDHPNEKINRKAIEIFNTVLLDSDELTRDVFEALSAGKVPAIEIQRLFSLSQSQYRKIVDTTRKKILDLLSSYEQ